jgi:hypothetical protein
MLEQHLVVRRHVRGALEDLQRFIQSQENLMILVEVQDGLFRMRQETPDGRNWDFLQERFCKAVRPTPRIHEGKRLEMTALTARRSWFSAR